MLLVTLQRVSFIMERIADTFVCKANSLLSFLVNTKRKTITITPYITRSGTLIAKEIAVLI